ncbi:hypothetical protein BURCENBC7_AP1394 [Burkholderia cenocepacia BC7]|nr:hypothetical protein BURCENK562V_C7450 [Burkholderia cenocepacia K56-2Valvano]ERI27059.1 hypothetical protein BURCENBC7_AP1394 [Burkholderia cenocepacia BC7]
MRSMSRGACGQTRREPIPSPLGRHDAQVERTRRRGKAR